MWSTPAVWKQYIIMAVLHFFLHSKFLSLFSMCTYHNRVGSTHVYWVHQTGWYNEQSLDPYPWTGSDHTTSVPDENSLLFFYFTHLLKNSLWEKSFIQFWFPRNYVLVCKHIISIFENLYFVPFLIELNLIYIFSRLEIFKLHKILSANQHSMTTNTFTRTELNTV